MIFLPDPTGLAHFCLLQVTATVNEPFNYKPCNLLPSCRDHDQREEKRAQHTEVKTKFTYVFGAEPQDTA